MRSPGSFPQFLMRTNPAQEELQQCYSILRGVVTQVFLTDDPQNATGQTVVNVRLLDGWPEVERVPLVYTYINDTEGEEWTPKVNDAVVVQFINGNFRFPVVTGFLSPPVQSVTAKITEAYRNNRRRNGTTETIDKLGNRTVHVAANETLEVIGNGSVTIGGNLTVNITGNATVTIGGNLTATVTGTADITSDGNLTLTAPQVIIDSPDTQITGDISTTGTAQGSTGAASFTGNVSSEMNVSDQTRSMAADRSIYNGHTHGSVAPGIANTGIPTQQE